MDRRRRVKRFRVSGLSARRIDGCRRPAWRCADRVLIALARSEAPRRPAGFPGPVSTAVRPCAVLGLSRVSGGADLRLESSESRTPEELLIHFHIRSRGLGPPPVSRADAGALQRSFVVATARTIRAILFSSAASQGSSVPRRNAHRMTAVAPATGGRRRSRRPVFEIRPSFGFPRSSAGGEVAPAPEALHRRREGLGRHGANGADSRNARQALRRSPPRRTAFPDATPPRTPPRRPPRSWGLCPSRGTADRCAGSERSAADA